VVNDLGAPGYRLARISYKEHQTEWKDNTILINYTPKFRIYYFKGVNSLPKNRVI
jgi:hypothetical protein